MKMFINISRKFENETQCVEWEIKTIIKELLSKFIFLNIEALK